MTQSAKKHSPWPGRMGSFFIFVLLLAAPALLFLKPLFQGAIPWFMDTLMYFVPVRTEAARLLAHGEWPLWNRCLMGGVPLFENPQAALAYPAHWAFLLWPSGLAFTLPLLLHLGMWAALTFWALRRIGVARGGALFAGAVALAGSYGWSRLQFGNYLNVLPWWPLWLGAAHAFAAAGGPLWLVVGGVAVALAVLAGAHQLAAYGLAGLAVYALMQVALARGRRRRWFFFLVLTFVFGIAIAAPGWLPQAAFIRETPRPQGLAAQEVLAGTLGSWRDLAGALTGDLKLVKAAPGEPWSDAESQAALGLVALVLATLAPAPRRLRRAWLGCWLAALLGIALSLRAVMEPLLAAVPQAGVFHDPRRWLGMSQWMLILAAGLGAGALGDLRRRPGMTVLVIFRQFAALALLGAVAAVHYTGAPRLTAAWAALAIVALALFPLARFRAARLAFGLLLTVSVALLGHLTWTTTDLKTLPLGPLLHPQEQPLIARAGLNPGQRFFTLDFQRAASYDYARPDLADWALPNLACLWGVEDLGGYEPAQSQRYRAFIQQLYQEEPWRWRQGFPQHFGLITEPLAAKALNEGNVHAAIFPRWGAPVYFDRNPQTGELVTGYPRGLSQNFQARAMLLDAASSEALHLSVSDGGNTWQQRLAPPRPATAADDLAASTATLGGPRTEEPGAGHLLAAAGDLPPIFGDPRPWTLEPPRQGTLLGFYIWNEDYARLWKPVVMGQIAVLMRYRGAPAWTEWRGGEGEVITRTIKANRLELEVNVKGGAGETSTTVATDAQSVRVASSSVSTSSTMSMPSTVSTVSTASGAQPVTLIIHDAWWPGWQATVDGRRAEVRPEGLWRALDLAPGRHRIEMRYDPPGVEQSLRIASISGAALLVGCMLVWLLRAMVGVRRR